MIAFTLAMLFALVGWSFGLVQTHRLNSVSFSAARKKLRKMQARMMRKYSLRLGQLADLRIQNERLRQALDEVPEQRILTYLEEELILLTGKSVDYSDVLQYQLPMVSTTTEPAVIRTLPVMENGHKVRYVWPVEAHTKRFVDNELPIIDTYGNYTWGSASLCEDMATWEPFEREYAVKATDGKEVWLPRSEYKPERRKNRTRTAEPVETAGQRHDRLWSDHFGRKGRGR